MRIRGFLAAAVILGGTAPLFAGMAGPLPVDSERVLRLNDPPLARLQALSFFLLALLLCSAAVWGLWHALRRDFPALPRLSFFKAVAAILLWGLLAVIVLTMISGARELMTPGAWQRQGLTYRLAEADRAPEATPLWERRQQLEKLRVALLHFAATHQGRFPREDERTALPDELWSVPDSGGLRYLYVSGRTAEGPVRLLVYEPELDVNRRLVLKTDGEIVLLRSSEIRGILKAEGRP
jgi:hypothetical protein